MTFDGKVTVTLDVRPPTTSITLNAIDMTFSSASLTPLKGKLAFAVPKVAVNTTAQTATFTFAQPVSVGSYRLTMAYAGKIGTQANGRSEEHTSELQSLMRISYAVFCLKKTNKT